VINNNGKNLNLLKQSFILAYLLALTFASEPLRYTFYIILCPTIFSIIKLPFGYDKIALVMLNLSSATF
jgi:hypothetical protein